MCVLALLYSKGTNTDVVGASKWKTIFEIVAVHGIVGIRPPCKHTLISYFTLANTSSGNLDRPGQAVP